MMARRSGNEYMMSVNRIRRLSDQLAPERGQRANRQPDEEDDGLRSEPDLQRHADALERAGELVAAELVGAEPVVDGRGRSATPR